MSQDKSAAPTSAAVPAVPPHASCCGKLWESDEPIPEVGRLVPAAHDMEMPEIPFPSARVLAVAGEETLRHLVRHHHVLLRESEIGPLFPADETAFTAAVELIADYVVEVCGGPAQFTPSHGKTCLRKRHFPFTIDELAREIWLEKLFQAMVEIDFPEEIHEEYWNWMEAFTVRLINRRRSVAQPMHLTYARARVRFTRLLPA